MLGFFMPAAGSRPAQLVRHEAASPVPHLGAALPLGEGIPQIRMVPGNS